MNTSRTEIVLGSLLLLVCYLYYESVSLCNEQRRLSDILLKGLVFDNVNCQQQLALLRQQYGIKDPCVLTNETALHPGQDVANGEVIIKIF